jgi:predicted lipoprotein with Yx(FWY)xxD motif
MGLGMSLALAVSMWATPYAAVLAQQAPTLTTRNVPGIGTILTDATGMTVYTYKRDSPGVSTCYDQCAASWPAVLADGDVTAGDGVGGSLDVAARQDGNQQVTYNGMPLYRFAEDTKPGDTLGEGLANVWFIVSLPEASVVAPTPAVVTSTPVTAPAPAPPATPTTPAAPSGYGY